MTRAILASYDPLTPFEPRAQTSYREIAHLFS